MKQLFFSFAMILIISNYVFAQKYYTKNANISFFSKTSMENIKADNNQVMTVLNTQTGDLQFSVIIKSFQFEKALMEEHFNENYMESEKYPKATFKGIITDLKNVSFEKDGVYNVTVTGDMNMHGATKKITSSGSITVSAGKISANSKFLLKPEDYNISIPKLVRNNIAESIEVTVSSNFDQKM